MAVFPVEGDIELTYWIRKDNAFAEGRQATVTEVIYELSG